MIFPRKYQVHVNHLRDAIYVGIKNISVIRLVALILGVFIHYLDILDL